MQDFADASGCCGCPPMSAVSYPVADSVSRSRESGEKFYHEIATEMINNALIIRVEKDKSRSRRSRCSWDPPCDCDMIEIKRPTSREKARIVNGGDNNQILFKVFSKSRIPKDDSGYQPQTIAYKVGSCRGADESNDQCRTITVHPQMGGSGSQEVHSDHVTEGSQDVFLLRIKKNGDTIDPKQRNIELELRTPRPPTPPPPSPPPQAPAQLNPEKKAEDPSSSKDKEKGKGKRKEKGKGKGKGKGKK